MAQTKNKTAKTIIIIFSLCIFYALGYFMGLRKKTTALSLQSFYEKNQVYAIANGETIMSDQVWPKIQEDLRQLEKNKYLIKKHAVENFLLEKERTSNQDKSATAVETAAPQYTKEELAQFVKERNINISKLKPKAREDLINNFIIHKKMLAQKAKAQTELKTQNIDWLIPMTYLDPAVKVEPGPLANLSTANAKSSLIVFANYHCPYCPEAQRKIILLKEKYKDQLSINFRFSMQEPESSMVFLSALAANCANEQNKFAEFHQALFAKTPITLIDISAIAESTGLNMKEFTPCLETMKYKKEVLADTEAADKLGINRQAVAFVNGHLLQIQEPLETFESILNQKN